MVKLELHTHTADDPNDRIPYSTRELIDRAVALGFGALAVTLHDRQLDLAPYRADARERGLTLISGVERTFDGVHVLLLNFPQEAERLRSFDELRRLKARTRGLVVVPHPFYPLGSAIGRRGLASVRDLVDAVEWNSFYTRLVNFNKEAAAYARAEGLPLVGNSDLHRLDQFGRTYTLVDVPEGSDPDAICDAIRQGRVEVRTEPFTTLHIAWLAARMLTGDVERIAIRAAARFRGEPAGQAT